MFTIFAAKKGNRTARLFWLAPRSARISDQGRPSRWLIGLIGIVAQHLFSKNLHTITPMIRAQVGTDLARSVSGIVAEHNK
jgi:hypothetical protein